MRSIRVIAVVATALLGLVSCSRDPNVVKKKFLDSANRYFEKGRYKEAVIQYKNALKRDAKYTYGTKGTPTTNSLEVAWTELSGAAGTVLVPSGLAAISG